MYDTPRVNSVLFQTHLRLKKSPNQQMQKKNTRGRTLNVVLRVRCNTAAGIPGRWGQDQRSDVNRAHSRQGIFALSVRWDCTGNGIATQRSPTIQGMQNY